MLTVIPINYTYLALSDVAGAWGFSKQFESCMHLSF